MFGFGICTENHERHSVEIDTLRDKLLNSRPPDIIIKFVSSNSQKIYLHLRFIQSKTSRTSTNTSRRCTSEQGSMMLLQVFHNSKKKNLTTHIDFGGCKPIKQTFFISITEKLLYVDGLDTGFGSHQSKIMHMIFTGEFVL